MLVFAGGCFAGNTLTNFFLGTWKESFHANDMFSVAQN